MQRDLLIIRHAKSSWSHAGLSDYERPLNKRGLKNASEMGQRLADNKCQVDHMVSSPALRAITTAKLIAAKIDYDINNIVLKHDIYEAGLNALLDIIHNLDNKYYSVALIGHNPGFTYLSNYLCHADIDNLPTCGIIQIRFDIDTWPNISENNGELIFFDYPKNK